LKEQIKVARGEKLSFSQADLAIEATLLKYAYALKIPRTTSCLILAILPPIKFLKAAACAWTMALKKEWTSPFSYDP